jgi:AbrB family looped-hinge helix DNA binding protein
LPTNVTTKGQVTLPKKVREAAGIKPGDRVEVRAAGNTVVIEKPRAERDYRARLAHVAKMRVIRGATTDEIMKMTRGDPARDKSLKRK